MKKRIQYRSDFLFPETGFLTGMGSAFNIAGNYYEFAASESENEADRKALESDWGMVGEDFRTAAKTCKDQDLSNNLLEESCHI